MKKLLLAFLALLSITAQVSASTPGQWDAAGQQPIAYPAIGPSGVFTAQLGDGSNAHGGLPPFFANEPADIPSTVTTQVTENTASAQVTGTDELKLRLTLFSNHVLPDDPLRSHCQRGASHLHEFAGPPNAGACSTFQQVRNDCLSRHTAGKIASTNPGDDVQCSAYWHPVLIDRNPLADGVDRIKRVLLIPLYYQLPDGGCGGVNACLVTQGSTFIDFPLGFGYVNGSNMDDPWMLKLQAAIAAANAASVAAGGTARYSLSTGAMGPRGDGMVGWFCNSPAGVQRGAIQPTIDDLDCQAGDTLIGEIHGAGCADGKNLYSPSGYDHVLPPIHVSATNGNFDDVCPIGDYKIAELIFKPQWILKSAISSTVPNDTPYLSSDAGYQTKARADASACVTATNSGSSATVCAPGGASTFVCKAGCSFHNDYFVAWMLKYLRRAFRNCLAVPQTSTTETGAIDADQTVHGQACNSNTLSFNSGSGLGSQLIVNPSFHQPVASEVNGDAISDYYPTPVPKGHMGPMTMPH